MPYPWLPNELWTFVVSELDTTDRCALRLVNRDFETFINPILFDKVEIDLVSGGFEHVLAIGDCEKLATCVRHLIHRRRGILPFIPDLECFQLAVDPEYTSGWSEFTDHEKKSLFEAYSSAREQQLLQARKATRWMVFHVLGSRTFRTPVRQATERSNPVQGDEEVTMSLLPHLGDALVRLPNLTAFTQSEEVREDPYRWDTVTFRENGLDEAATMVNHAWDVQDMQLSYLLALLGWRNSLFPTLRHIAFATLGPAFWTTQRLRLLLDDPERWLTEELEDGTYQNTVHFEEGSPSIFGRGSDEVYVKQLYLISEAFTCVTHLTLDVHDPDEGSIRPQGKGPFLTATGVFTLLRRMQQLQTLRLGYSVADDEGRTATDLLAYLIDSKPWKTLGELAFTNFTAPAEKIIAFLHAAASSIHTLSLQHVTLVRGSECWESALPRIVQGLPKLQDLQVAWLYDSPCKPATYPEGKRTLFRDEFFEDMGGFNPWIAHLDCYQHHKKALRDVLLARNKGHMPPFDDEIFLRSHVCPNET